MSQPPTSAKRDTDSSAFYVWKIPVMDFHSLTRDTTRLLHSKQNVRSAIDLRTYYDQYRFLVAYLDYLDTNI